MLTKKEQHMQVQIILLYRN